MLAAVGAGSTSLAGCLDFLSGVDPDGDGESEGPGSDENGSADEDGADGDEGSNGQSDEDGEETEDEDDEETEDEDGEETDGIRWPAIESGEVISDFEDLSAWAAVAGETEAAPDEARTGSQAMVVESDENQVGVKLPIAEGVDLDGWDTSMAVKMESANRIDVEFNAPEPANRLTSIRRVPADYDGWLRIDFGYIQKHGDPDLSNVTQFFVKAYGPDDGPTRIVVDDLRRTEAVDNGKAILAFHGGLDSHYEVAELLDERDWAGAVPVNPGAIDGQGRMDLDELRQLRDRGWDICSLPSGEGALPELAEGQQKRVVDVARKSLEQHGFEDGARHFFAPGDRMNETTTAVVREGYESGFLFGACPTGAPPTGIHTTSVIWGPDLHGGVRRAINLCDQFNQLIVLRIPRIVEGGAEEDANSMPLEDFEHLLDHIDHRGLDVITPSDVVDGTMDDGDDADEPESAERPDGVILEAGDAHTFEGEGGGTSEEFELAEGILTGSFSHEGDSAFVVEVTPIDGTLENDLLTTTSGTTIGESLTVVGEGTYRLEIEADGPWSIDLDQPEVHADDLEELPVEASGSGSSFVGPLWTEDDISLTATHDGDGEFLVDGYGADGSWEQIVNRTGEFDGSRSFSASGTVWIDVEADGDWTLEIS